MSNYGQLGDYYANNCTHHGHVVGAMTGDILSGGKPHKSSYRPDLPLSQVRQIREEVGSQGRMNGHATTSLISWADSVVREHDAQTHDKPAKVEKSAVSTSRPHVRSYRADLPLGGFTDAQLHKVTKEDKAYYASRPIELLPYTIQQKTCCNAVDASVRYGRSFGGCDVCQNKLGSPEGREKSRKQLGALNVIDKTQGEL